MEPKEHAQEQLSIYEIISTSRPHFWIYEFGTYIVGIAAAVSASTSGISLTGIPIIAVILFGLYFLFPANLYIYGINDIYDFETDLQNPKKDDYEIRIFPEQHTQVWWWIIGTNTPFVILALLLNISFIALVWLGLFLFFAAFYSAPPIRAKTTPGMDSIFSGAHYVATGVFGFLVAGGSTVIWPIIFAALLWSMAMHAYSAVPDIKADTASNIPTIAVALGAKHTVYLCLLLYAAAGIIISLFIGQIGLILALPYLLLMLVSLDYMKKDKLFRIYTIFPYINTTIGMVLFFVALFS